MMMTIWSYEVHEQGEEMMFQCNRSEPTCSTPYKSAELAICERIRIRKPGANITTLNETKESVATIKSTSRAIEQNKVSPTAS